MNWSVLTTLLPALFAAIVGGGVVHLFTRRRDAENERRKQRLEYLLARIFHPAVGDRQNATRWAAGA